MNEIEIVSPQGRDLGGGFHVRRLLPSAQLRSVGPFVFFDHFGPVHAGPDDQHDVRPHPHIGLATVTYLFEGAMMHRDSTGVVQRIEPGAINWMTAGRGIVHSERTPEDLRGRARVSHGLQLWAALPAEHEEVAPAFSHTPADDIPQREAEGVTLRVLVGRAQGLQSPVAVLSPTLYLDAQLEPGARLLLDFAVDELAVYAVEGAPLLDDVVVPPHHLAMAVPGRAARLNAPTGARVAIIGGQPLGPRYLWWNFVSTRRQRIAQAADDWQADRFGRVPGETERIPLPPRRPPTTG